MKVTFRQSGGIGGLVKGKELDSEQMPAEEAAKLEALVRQSDITEDLVDHSPAARDIYRYDLTIDHGGQTRRLSIDDRTLPDRARPLIRFLQSHAMPLPRR